MSIEKLELPVKDLQVGDHLVDFMVRGSGTWHSARGYGSIDWKVSSVEHDCAKLVGWSDGRYIGAELFDSGTVFRVVRGEEVDIVAGNLLPGDVVVACWDTSKHEWFRYAGRYEVTKVKNGVVNTKSQNNGGIGIMLADPVRVLAIRSGAPAAVVAKSPWNGRCGACGRNTYTGFLAVEHEGGSCAAR